MSSGAVGSDEKQSRASKDAQRAKRDPDVEGRDVTEEVQAVICPMGDACAW